MIKLVYTPEEAKKLASMGELNNININNDNKDATVVFEKEHIIDTNVDDTDFNFDEI